MTDEEIKENVSEKAIRYGVPTQYSSLFDDLDDEFTINFKREISNRQFGLPIVRYSHPNGNWVLIGTKELAWFNNEKIQFINLKEIFGSVSLDRKEAETKETDRRLVKFQLEQVGIHTKGDRIDLFIKNGAEFFAFQHILIRILRII